MLNLKDGRFPLFPQVPGDSQECHQPGDMWAVSQSDRAGPWGPSLDISMTNSSTSTFPQLWAWNHPLCLWGRELQGKSRIRLGAGSRDGHKPELWSAQIVNFWAVILPLQFWWLHPHSSGLWHHQSTGISSWATCLNKEREILSLFLYIKSCKNNLWQREGCFKGLSLLLLPGCEEYWFEVILHSAVIHHHKHLQSTEPSPSDQGEFWGAFPNYAPFPEPTNKAELFFVAYKSGSNICEMPV